MPNAAPLIQKRTALSRMLYDLQFVVPNSLAADHAENKPAEDWKEKWFSTEYVEALADHMKDVFKEAMKWANINLIMVAFTFLYLKGVTFEVQIGGLKVQQFPGLLECMVLASALLGLSFSAYLWQFFAFYALIYRWMQIARIPFGFNLALLRYIPLTVNAYAASDEGSAFKFVEKVRLHWPSALPSLTMVIVYALAYYYVQIAGLHFIVGESKLDGFTRVGMVVLIAAANVACFGTPIALFSRRVVKHIGTG